MNNIRLLIPALLLSTFALISLNSQETTYQIIFVAIQRFQTGEMICRADTGVIYVLANTHIADSGAVQTYTPAEYTNLPEVDLFPDNVYYEPGSDFSKIRAHMADVQTHPGQPVGSEIGFKTRVTRINDQLLNERTDGRVYRIDDNGFWHEADSFPASTSISTPADTDGRIDKLTSTPRTITPSSTLTVTRDISGTEVEYANFSILDTMTHEALQPVDVNVLVAPTRGEMILNIPDSHVGDILIRLDAVEGTFSSGYTQFDRQELIVETSTDSTLRVEAMYQPFEHGFALLVHPYNHIFTFRDDGMYSFHSADNRGFADIPVPDDVITPADAFTGIWNVYRDKLGNPMAAPQDYTLTIEQADYGDMLYTLPDGTVVHADVDVYTRGAWHYQQR